MCTNTAQQASVFKFMHGHHMHVYMYRSIKAFMICLQYLCQKESSIVWPDPFLVQGVYRL